MPKQPKRSPEGVLVKDRVWEKIGYEPHARQRPIHASKKRFRINAAGRRFGKSVIGGHELTLEAIRTYFMQEELRKRGIRREFWIVGPGYSDSEKEFRVVYNDLKKIGAEFDRPGTYNSAHSGDMVISLYDGLYICHAKSALPQHEDRLVGEGLSGVIMAEAAKMKPRIWMKHIRPALADFRGWALFNSTPEGKNWFYDNWMLGQDPDNEEWDSWRNPSWNNPIVFPGGETDPEILSMRDGPDMSEELFNQEVAAKFTEYVGRVFKNFDEEYHVGNYTRRRDLPYFGAVDYGWTNPFVWLDIQVDAFDNVYVIGEYYEYRKDTEEHAKYLLSTGRGEAREFFPDPAEPDDTYTLSKYLHVPSTSRSTGGSRKTRIELIRTGLKLGPEHRPEGERKPKLFIDKSCKNLIREMNDWRYPESKKEADRNPKEEPMDKDNHGPEALGRFYMGYYGPPVQQQGSVIRKSKYAA